MKLASVGSFGKTDCLILTTIAIFAILYSYLNPLTPPSPDSVDFFEILEPVEYGIVGMMSLWYARKFNWKVEVFSKSYFALGMGYILLVPGMIAYYYNEFFELDSTFVTFFGIPFTLYYGFMIYHLSTNCRFFKRRFEWYEKLSIFAMPVIVVVLHSYFIIQSEGSISPEALTTFPDLMLNPVSMVLAIIAIRTFKNSFLGNAWLFIAIGIFVISIADFWYVYLELFNMYTRAHPVQNLFHISNMLMIYGLYKHYKVFS